MTAKTLVERLREYASVYLGISGELCDEAAALIEHLTANSDGEPPKSLEEVRSRHSAFECLFAANGGYRSQEVADVGFLLGIVEQLTASRDDWTEKYAGMKRKLLLAESDRDRHERDVNTWRQRWIEKCAEVERLQRAHALELGRLRATDAMHFTPLDGRCYACSHDLVAHYGADRIAAGLNVTGCPKCHRSYCD